LLLRHERKKKIQEPHIPKNEFNRWPARARAAAAVPRGWINVIPHTVATTTTTAASDKENCLFHTTQAGVLL
jgi:hypothetical protein